MTTITIEVEIPFDDLLRTLDQLTESELAQLIEYASVLLSGDLKQLEEQSESQESGQVSSIATDENLLQ